MALLSFASRPRNGIVGTTRAQTAPPCSKDAPLDYKNFGRGRDQIALDEHDEQAYQQAYGRATSTPGVSDSVPGIRPAHPLPSYRSSRLDYDRYLERPRDKFQIFSAQNRRRKARTIASSVALGLFVVACIVAIIVLLTR